jgi:hypothetical protein
MVKYLCLNGEFHKRIHEQDGANTLDGHAGLAIEVHRERTGENMAHECGDSNFLIDPNRSAHDGLSVRQADLTAPVHNAHEPGSAVKRS